MDILITEEVPGARINQLREHYEIIADPTLWNDADRLRASLGRARAVMVRNQTQISAALLDAAPRLLAIGRIGVGLDNIDLPAASAHGVVVIAPLGANAVSVAEMTIGLMLALTRKICAADRATRRGAWDRHRFTGMEMRGKTAAIIGFGRVGREVAQRAAAFELNLRLYDPYLRGAASGSAPAAGHSIVACPTLLEAVRDAEFVTAHAPLTPETRQMFNAPVFRAMKAGAFFINTSRGGVVDEAALLEALRSGHLGGAGLDVREKEPPGEGDEFSELPNVILTPHIASFSHEAQARTVDAVASDLARVLEGEPAIHFINFPTPSRPQDLKALRPGNIS